MLKYLATDCLIKWNIDGCKAILRLTDNFSCEYLQIRTTQDIIILIKLTLLQRSLTFSSKETFEERERVTLNSPFTPIAIKNMIGKFTGGKHRLRGNL